jgi:hypothetical protein
LRNAVISVPHREPFAGSPLEISIPFCRRGFITGIAGPGSSVLSPGKEDESGYLTANRRGSLTQAGGKQSDRNRIPVMILLLGSSKALIPRIPPRTSKGTNMYASPHVCRALLVFLCLAWMQAAPGRDKAPAPEEKNDPKAVALIREAAEEVYNPVREGLKSLSFSIPIQTPYGLMGTEFYWFEAPDRFKYKLEPNPEWGGASGSDSAATAAYEATKKEAADKLGTYLGNFLTQDLDHYTVFFVGSRQPKPRVRCKVKPDGPEAGWLHSKDLLFDEAGHVTGLKWVDVQGHTRNWKLTFKPLEGTRLRLLEKIEKEIYSPEGKMCMVQTYTYSEVKGYYLPSRTEITFSDTGRKVAMDTLNLKVNEPIDPSVFDEGEKDEPSSEPAPSNPDKDS